MNSDLSMPPSWTYTPLSDICDLNPALDRCFIDDAAEVHFVPMAAVDEEFGGVRRSERRAYGQVKKGYTPFVAGDVIVAKITPCMENGKGGVVNGTDGLAYFGSTEFHVLRPRAGIHPWWIGRFISQHSIRHAARLKMKGSAGQLRVPEDFLDTFVIPLAPAAEQVRILDRVDQLFTDLAAGEAALDRVKKKLTRYRSAVLHAAVTGRLTAEWRKNHGLPAERGDKLLARILIERRRQWEQRTLPKYARDGRTPPKNWPARYIEPAPPKADDLQKLPEGWCWANLACVKDFSMYGPRFSSDAYTPSGVRVLRTTDFDDNGNIDLTTPPCLPLTAEQFEQYKLLPGDLLVTRTGSLGTLAVFQGGADSIAGAFLIFYRLNDCILPTYAFICLRAAQSELVRRGTGVGRPNLNIPAIDSIPIALPPLIEQAAIIEAVNEKLSQIDAMEAEVARGLARAARLRQAILKTVFEGKLVPQNSADEPAAILLARVRAERATAAESRSPRSRRTRKMVSS